MVEAILKHEGIPKGVNFADLQWIDYSLKEATKCASKKDPSDFYSGNVDDLKEREKEMKIIRMTDKTKFDRTDLGLLQGEIKRVEENIAKCESLLKRDLQKEYDDYKKKEKEKSELFRQREAELEEPKPVLVPDPIFVPIPTQPTLESIRATCCYTTRTRRRIRRRTSRRIRRRTGRRTRRK